MAKDLLHALAAVLLLSFWLAGCDDTAATSAQGSAPVTEAAATDYIGSAACAGCHQQAWQHWQQSHHQLAMAQADASTVLGDFADAQLRYGAHSSRFQTQGTNYVVTMPEGQAGLKEVTVRYTFGVEPLQQYLVDMGKWPSAGAAHGLGQSRPTSCRRSGAPSRRLVSFESACSITRGSRALESWRTKLEPYVRGLPLHRSA